MMNKLIFGIFAHPDDEAFGPSGTLLKATKSGAELHLITLTLGDAGTNPDNVPDLAATREKEWREAGRLMGATSMHYLGYLDGQLNNQNMIEAQDKITSLISEIVKKSSTNTEVEIISTDTNGISGHIDHIVAGRAASYAFYKLKESIGRPVKLLLACVPKSHLPSPNTSWLYMEAGRDDHEIGLTVDAREYKDEIIAIMRAHYSQRGDGEAHIKNGGDNIGINHFIVKE